LSLLPLYFPGTQDAFGITFSQKKEKKSQTTGEKVVKWDDYACGQLDGEASYATLFFSFWKTKDMLLTFKTPPRITLYLQWCIKNLKKSYNNQNCLHWRARCLNVQ